LEAVFVRPLLRNAAKEALRAALAGHFVWRLPTAGQGVALTFDDGPDPEFTPKVLDMLARQKVKATFFVIGRNVTRFPELCKRIADEGHGLGGHTFDHLEIPTLSPAELTRELETCRGAIRDAAKVDSKLFRPPRGRMSVPSVLRVARLGYDIVHWTKTYSDYQRDGTEPLERRMRAQPAAARDIILLHDHNPHTIEALEAMIPRWTSEGLTFQSL
jgi:peptidoglycan/xylan/chitin deacetylase (PgdA/CDA1 family)